MTTKNKTYLFFSVLVLLLTFVGIFQNFKTIHFIGFETEIIWIPIWIVIIVLPLLNLYEIAVNTDDINRYYWLALILNLISIFFLLRYFEIILINW